MSDPVRFCPETRDDPAARSWRAAYEAAPEPCRWSREDVEEALAWAHGVLRRHGPRVLPAQFTALWPAFTSDEVTASPPAPERITAEQWSEIDRIIGSGSESARQGAGWLARYLLTEAENFAVGLWCYGIEHGRSFRTLVKAHGLVQQTQNDRKLRGLYRIAEGLCREHVVVSGQALRARAEREKRPLSGSEDGWGAALADPSPPVAGGGPAPDLTTFLAEVEAAQAIENPAARAQHVQSLIGWQIRQEQPEHLARRASSLTKLLTSRGWFDRAALRCVPAGLGYRYPGLRAEVQVQQAVERDLYTFEIAGSRHDVEDAMAEILARWPADAFGTHFTVEPLGRRATGARRSHPFTQPAGAEP